MGAFYDLIPGKSTPTAGAFDDLIPQRGATESLTRGAGLGGRAVVKGVLGIPTAMLDAGIAAGNLINRGTNALGLTDAEPFPSASVLTDRVLDSIGFARPETGEERVASDVMAAATGGGGGARFLADQATKATTPVARGVLDKLGAAPAAQTLAAASGGAAASIAGESEADPLTQLTAGLVGAAAPSAVAAGAQAGVRGAVRGGERGRQQYDARRQDFEAAGIAPTAGQAAGTRRMQAIESGLAKVPGGSGPLAAHAEREAAQMRARIDEISSDLAPGSNATKAGRTIEKGLSSFVDRFRAEQRFLYDKVDRYIPPVQRVPVSSVASKLDELVQPIAGAENVSAGMTNPTIAKMRQLLAADAVEGTLPYEAVKRLRSLVGEKIGNPTLTDDIGTARWKQIYGALSDDMGEAARAAGPEAERAFGRANSFTRAGHDRIESVLDRVGGKDSAEQVFRAAVNPTEVREGGTTVNAVMRSLSPDERRVVSAAVVRRLGQAAPSAQDATGDVFSSETFLTNWNKISPEAKRALFSDADAQRGLDSLALAAERIRDGSKVFATPSGTARAGAQLGTYGGLGAAAVTGNVGAAGTILTGLLAANGASRLLSNPAFVKWVGQTTRLPAELVPSELALLVRRAEKWPREDKLALDELVARFSAAGKQ